MDSRKFYDITHRDHVFCNPLSSAKFDELIDVLHLAPGARVLDIACGKAELLIRLVERYGVSGVGVDISPYCIRDARAKAAARVPQAEIPLVEMDAAHYQAGGDRFDLAMCVGASWIWHGHRDTLRALSGFVHSNGLVLAGEPFWRQPPDPAYLAAEGMRVEDFSTHDGNMAIGIELGLTPLYIIAGSKGDWDRYESLQWLAAERFAVEHPEDPDLPELLARVRKARDVYLRWGRDTLGWALYLFRR
jgi:SAM-dependent methyltransferase